MTSLGLIKSPDALFKSQQRLVDFSSILFGLLTRVNYVSTSFRTSEIDERHLTKQFASVFNGISEDSVTTRGLLIRTSLTASSALQTSVDNFHHLLNLSHLTLRKAHNLNSLSTVLPALDLFPFIEQVVQFATVDLVKRDVQLQTLVSIQQIHNIIRGESVHA